MRSRSTSRSATCRNPARSSRRAKAAPGAHADAAPWRARFREPVEYWDPRFTLDRQLTLGDATAELSARLDESVRLRMIAEVPLGAFLSGGVDSSAVVAAMASVSAEPVNTCSIAFADPAYDESPLRVQVAERYRTRHFVDRVESDDFDLIDDLARLYDEPYADSSAIPTYRVCQLARRHVTVALSGDGGDENFGGYRRYRLHLMEERMRGALPLSLRRPVFGLLGHLYPKADWAPRVFRAKSTFEALGRDSVEAYFHGVSILRDGHAAAAVHRRLQGAARRLQRDSRCSGATHARPAPTIRWRWSSTSISRPTSSATSTPRSIARAWRTRWRCASR